MNKIIYLIINLGLKLIEFLIDRYLKKDPSKVREARFDIKKKI